MEEIVKELHIRTKDFEKGFVAVQQLALPLELNKKMRVVLEYDPQKSSTTIQYFKIEE